MKFISINLNEVNLKWLKEYSEIYHFDNIKKLLGWNFVQTISEKKYQHLEPWIQWPTYYLGKSYNEHKLFHLGDAEQSKNYSIFDHFQNKEKATLALAPMNCTFIPSKESLLFHDPWSKKGISSNSKFLNNFWDAICYFVNENSNESSLRIKHLYYFIIGFLKFARFNNYLHYIKLIFISIFFKWSRAILLDLLLFDIFYYFFKTKNYEFSTLFLNAGAHIQHHYFFDSKIYKMKNGKHMNPISYSSKYTKFLDPLYQIYKIYNHIALDIINLGKNNNIEVTTALQQKDNHDPYFQYRIKDIELFFSSIGLQYKHFVKKMSRDIYIFFNNRQECVLAKKMLSSFLLHNKPLFKIYVLKNNNLFVQIIYRGNDNKLKEVIRNNKVFDFTEIFSIVSIENAIHKSDGWHINNFHKFKKNRIHLKDLTKELYGFKKN